MNSYKERLKAIGQDPDESSLQGEDPGKDYFGEALRNFTRDFAYGGAIRHLVDKGYDVDMIIKEFNYPIPRSSIEKIVEDHKRNRKTGSSQNN